MAKTAKKEVQKRDEESSDESEDKKEKQLNFEQYKAMKEQKKKLLSQYNSP